MRRRWVRARLTVWFMYCRISVLRVARMPHNFILLHVSITIQIAYGACLISVKACIQPTTTARQNSPNRVLQGVLTIVSPSVHTSSYLAPFSGASSHASRMFRAVGPSITSCSTTIGYGGLTPKASLGKISVSIFAFVALHVFADATSLIGAQIKTIFCSAPVDRRGRPKDL